MPANVFKPAFGVFLALCSLWLAYRSWSDARFAHVSASSPATAIRERPNDSPALSFSLDMRQQREGRSAPTAAEMHDIELALAHRPLSRALLRQVGARAEEDKDIERADAAMTLSNALSRRDALTQLWWIERSVQKGDLPRAVGHYHAAMAVHPELKKILLPVLARALAFPEVRNALRPYVVQQSAWVIDLLNHSVADADPLNAARLLYPVAESVRGREYEPVIARLLSGMAQRGQFADATKLAKGIIPTFNTATIRAFAVSERNADPRLGKLAWMLADSGRLLATANERGGFDVDIEPLDQAAVADRILPVIGGRNYGFRQSVRGGGGATFIWEASCVPSGVAFWRQRFTPLTQVQHNEYTIAVPSGCTGVRFFLSGRGPEGMQGTRTTFEGLEFALRPN